MNAIQINEKYRISSDSRSWQVQKYAIERDKSGLIVREWKSVTWHGIVQQAITSLGQRMLREATRTDISGLRDEARQIEQILKRASEDASDGLESNIRRS